MNAQSSELNNASDHLVEIPLEVVLLHVNLLVSLDHILQLFLSLLSLLELKRDTEKEKGLLFSPSFQLLKLLHKEQIKGGYGFHFERRQMRWLRNCCVTKQIWGTEILKAQLQNKDVQVC